MLQQCPIVVVVAAAAALQTAQYFVAFIYAGCGLRHDAAMRVHLNVFKHECCRSRAIEIRLSMLVNAPAHIA